MGVDGYRQCGIANGHFAGYGRYARPLSEEAKRIKDITMKTLIISLFGVMLLLGASAQAEMYRWVDKDGKVHYTEQRNNQCFHCYILNPFSFFR